MGKPAAVTFSTGFQVNLGTIACLVDRRDVVYLDKQDHACIIDGARLGLGDIRKFRHNSPADLRRLMESDTERGLRGRADRRRRRRLLDGGRHLPPAGDRRRSPASTARP